MLKVPPNVLWLVLKSSNWSLGQQSNMRSIKGSLPPGAASHAWKNEQTIKQITHSWLPITLCMKIQLQGFDVRRAASSAVYGEAFTERHCCYWKDIFFLMIVIFKRTQWPWKVEDLMTECVNSISAQVIRTSQITALAIIQED